MNEQQIQALIDQSVARALAAKDEEIANAIGDALRTYADRPVGEKGSPSLQFGVVEQVEDTYAYVTLDGQTDAVPINMLGGLVVGERVAVLLVPPSGNLAIGMVQPTVVPGAGTFVQKMGYYNDGFSTLTSVSGSASTNIAWPPLAYGDALLDLSTPNLPTVTEDGYYTFSVTAGNNDATGAVWRATLEALPAVGGVAIYGWFQALTVAQTPAQTAPLSLTVPLAAGDLVAVNLGTGVITDLSLTAVVSKVSFSAT